MPFGGDIYGVWAGSLELDREHIDRYRREIARRTVAVDQEIWESVFGVSLERLQKIDGDKPEESFICE